MVPIRLQSGAGIICCEGQSADGFLEMILPDQEQSLNKQGDARAVRMIGGRPYRLGFLNARWDEAFNSEQPKAQALRRCRRENVIGGGQPLYHYTSLQGFQGIIETRGLWASDTRFLNDAEEMRHGAALVGEVVAHRRNRTKITAFANVLDQVHDYVLSPDRGSLIACFSRERDSLEQWRGYGLPGGICIGFGGFMTGNKTRQPARAPMFYGPSMLPRAVLYDRRSKYVMALSIIGRFEHEYELDRIAMPDYWPADHDENYVNEIGGWLRYITAGLKHPSFAQEAEVRVVIPQDDYDRYGGLKFRPSALGLIPYVNTGGQMDGLLDISSVLIGPSARQDLVAQSVRTFLDYHGYDDVTVEQSVVPFRS